MNLEMQFIFICRLSRMWFSSAERTRMREREREKKSAAFQVNAFNHHPHSPSAISILYRMYRFCALISFHLRYNPFLQPKEEKQKKKRKKRRKISLTQKCESRLGNQNVEHLCEHNTYLINRIMKSQRKQNETLVLMKWREKEGRD